MTGSIAIALALSDGSDVSTVSFVITRDGAAIRTGELAVGSDGRVSGTILGLAEGAGYQIEIVAPRTRADMKMASPCTGAAPFVVVADQVTAVALTLQCDDSAASQGNVVVNGSVNICPRISSASCTPINQVVGGTVGVSVAASDKDNDALQYAWYTGASYSAGAVFASTAEGTFTCTTPGTFALNVRVYDGDGRGCAKSLASPLAVTCVGVVLPGDDGGLPSELPPDPGGQAPTPVLDNLRPVATFTRESLSNNIVRINLLGLLDPTTNTQVPLSYQQTLFVSEGDQLQGFKVEQSTAGNNLAFSIAFVVDNSSSMDQEADKVADEIVAFVNLLAANGVNAKVAVVGENGTINGGIDFASPADVAAFLSRAGRSGTSRTVGFVGANATALSTKATMMNSGFGGNENGIHGIAYAEAALTFSASAQRVFVNITDEPTQPSGRAQWNTQTLCTRWRLESGTIQTIWSGAEVLEPSTPSNWTANSRENPGDLSRCSGGTITKVRADASDLKLTELKLTDVLVGSALIRYESANASVPQNVAITVKNGTTADGRSLFENVTFGAPSVP